MSTTTTTSTSTTMPNNQLNSTWTEPPWSGWIETTGDALLILEAARRGLIPRVTRRLVDSERKMITSGSVFVFDEDESGIKRWTDGFFWSPSRILGNFLLYRETDKRGAPHRKSDPGLPELSDGPQLQPDSSQLSRPRAEETHLAGFNKQREKILMGSLTNNPKFKPDGLMKKTFSLTIDGVAQHLISYYKIEDVQSGRLRSPSSLPELASLDISPEYLDKTHFRNPPKVEVGVDGLPRYRGEADDIDGSPPLLPAPLSTGIPLTDGRSIESSNASRRGERRPGPYPSSGPKRPRRKTGAGEPSTPTESQPPQALIPAPTVQATNYVEPVAAPPPQYPQTYGTVTNYYQMPAYTTVAAQTHPPPPMPHAYYTSGGPPQQSPPQTSYPYAYPSAPVSSAGDTQHHHHQQVTQDAGQQQHQAVYYSYAAQPHPVAYAPAWPSYAAYTTHGQPIHTQQQHHRQSSIANAASTANAEVDAMSGSSDEG